MLKIDPLGLIVSMKRFKEKVDLDMDVNMYKRP
jgi:hypothetical protein